MIFFTDLDNTLIYSYKHNIGEEKIAVENYQGREISFMTAQSHLMLRKIKDRLRVIPITTRTVEQYRRIDMGIGAFEYVLCCNGGILLKDNEIAEKWYGDSLNEIKDSLEELKKAYGFLKNDIRRTFELRFIDGLFIFTKCREPVQVCLELRDKLDCRLVDVMSNGIKIYVLPKVLNKGRAVKRLMKFFADERTMAAGDSEFDIALLNSADVGFAPCGFRERFGLIRKMTHIEEMPKDRLFSEAMLEKILNDSEISP